MQSEPFLRALQAQARQHHTGICGLSIMQCSHSAAFLPAVNQCDAQHQKEQQPLQHEDQVQQQSQQAHHQVQQQQQQAVQQALNYHRSTETAPLPPVAAADQTRHKVKASEAQQVQPARLELAASAARTSQQLMTRVAAQTYRSEEMHIDSLLNSIHKLSIFCSSNLEQQTLSADQRAQLLAAPLLTSMLAISRLARNFDSNLPVSEQLSNYLNTASSAVQNPSWLAERSGAAKQLQMDPHATRLAGSMSRRAQEVLAALCPLIAQTIPTGLHCGVVLFLEGYQGPKRLADAAMHLLTVINVHATNAVQNKQADAISCQMVANSYQLVLASLCSTDGLYRDSLVAVNQIHGSPAALPQGLSAPPQLPLVTAVIDDKFAHWLNMPDIIHKVQTTLVNVGRTDEFLGSANPAMMQLARCSHLDQLLILDRFCAQVTPDSCVTHCLHTMCNSHFHPPLGLSIIHSLLSRPDPPARTAHGMQLLNSAKQTGLLCMSAACEGHVTAALASISWQIQHVAVCCVVSILVTESDEVEGLAQSLHLLEQFRFFLSKVSEQPWTAEGQFSLHMFGITSYSNFVPSCNMMTAWLGQDGRYVCAMHDIELPWHSCCISRCLLCH